MAIKVIVHIIGEDAFLADLEELPPPTASYVLLRNVRKKDGKPLHYITDGATAFLYPWNRITFIETMGEVPGAAVGAANGAAPGTTIFGFFREDDKR